MPSPRAIADKSRPRSTPGTPLRGSRSGPLNAGAATGPYNPTNIRDRIYTWQNLSADALAPDEVDAPSDSRPPNKYKSSASEGAPDRRRAETAPLRPRSLSPSKPPTRGVPMNLEHEPRTPGSPKKRIVSDEHWMKTRPASDSKLGGNHAFSRVENPIELPKGGYEYDFMTRPEDGKVDGWVRKKKLEPVFKTHVELTPSGVKRWTEPAQLDKSHVRPSEGFQSVLKTAKSNERVTPPRPKSPPVVQIRKPQQSPPKPIPSKPIPPRNLEEKKAKLEYFAGRSPPKQASPPKAAVVPKG